LVAENAFQGGGDVSGSGGISERLLWVVGSSGEFTNKATPGFAGEDTAGAYSQQEDIRFATDSWGVG